VLILHSYRVYYLHDLTRAQTLKTCKVLQIKSFEASTALQDPTAQKRDLQRVHHLLHCQDLLYSIADLLQISLPPRRSCSPPSCSQAPFLWDDVVSPSASESEGLSFEDWLQTVDIRNTSAVHIFGKAICKCPVAFCSAWSKCKHENCFSVKLTTICRVLTGHTLSSAQVSRMVALQRPFPLLPQMFRLPLAVLQTEHVEALLCPSSEEKLSLQAFVLSVLQLIAGGCCTTLPATNVLVSPKELLLKCAQYACHHNINAEALWEMMCSTPARGGTGLDGIVQVVMKCMPKLSCQDAIRASALLLLQNSSPGCQV
jgi:hypothetical protein